MDKVRGGSYVEVELSDVQKEALNVELCRLLSPRIYQLILHLLSPRPLVFPCLILQYLNLHINIPRDSNQVSCLDLPPSYFV